MKKICVIGTCLLSLLTLNAYAINATPFAPVTYKSTIPNERPLLLPQDPKHFIIYTRGEITLIDAVNRKVAATLPKPNPYEDLKALFGLQSGKLLAADSIGTYLSNDLGKHWEKADENVFADQDYAPKFWQSKLQPQNLFAIYKYNLILSRDEGRTWQILYQGVSNSYSDVLQTLDGIYITHESKMKFTRDEGKTWLDINIGTDNYHHFCTSNTVGKAYVRSGSKIFAIKSPQEINLIYRSKDNISDCLVDGQQNLYVVSEDYDKRTIITLIDQNNAATHINSLLAEVKTLTQDNEGKSYLNTSMGLATAETLNSPVVLYPAIFKENDVFWMSVGNEKDLAITTGKAFESLSHDVYVTHDGGQYFSRIEGKYHGLFYYKGALNYLVQCGFQLCLKTTKDDGKTWNLTELPNVLTDNIENLYIRRDTLIIQTMYGYFFSSDLENWHGISFNNNHDDQQKSVNKKHKSLSIPTLDKKQKLSIKKFKSLNLKTFSAPNPNCSYYKLGLDISPSNVLTLVQHGCDKNDDIYTSKDDGAHWQKMNSSLSTALLNPESVEMHLLDNGDLLLLIETKDDAHYRTYSLHKSVDGGAHFTTLPLPGNFSWVSDFAHSGTSLLALSNIYSIYFSRDAGSTWERLNIPSSTVQGLHFANNKLFFVADEDGAFSATIE